MAAQAGGGDVVLQRTEGPSLHSTSLLVPITRSLSVSRYGTPQSISTYTPSSENAEDGSQEESAVDGVGSTYHNTPAFSDQPGPVARSTAPCRDFPSGLCPQGKPCRFSHDGKSRKPCYAFRRGLCRNGTLCKFSHDRQSQSREGNLPLAPQDSDLNYIASLLEAD